MKLVFTNKEEGQKILDRLKNSSEKCIPVELDKVFLPAYDTKPLPDFELHVNFPDCCPSHTEMLEKATASFNSFPDCCDSHRKLNQATWFNKADFSYVPNKIVYTLEYTLHAIETNIYDEQWYKNITDYIEHTHLSYGQLPNGYGPPVGFFIYISYLKILINQSKKISNEKKEKLDSYIEETYLATPPQKKESIPDINILISIYKRWLKIFPFDIPFFSNFKAAFEKTLPLISGKIEINKYSGAAKAQVSTQTELIEKLVNTTNMLLSSINTSGLIKAGKIPDINKVKLETIAANHKLKQSMLTQHFTNGEVRYVKTLKKWLKNEKEFFKSIQELNITAPAFTAKAIPFPQITAHNYLPNNSMMKELSTFMYSKDYTRVFTRQLSMRYHGKPYIKPDYNEPDLHEVKTVDELKYRFLKERSSLMEFNPEGNINDYFVTTLIKNQFLSAFELDFDKSPNKKALIDNTLRIYRRHYDENNQFAEMQASLNGEQKRDTIRTGYKDFFQGKNPHVCDRYSQFSKEATNAQLSTTLKKMSQPDYINNYEKTAAASNEKHMTELPESTLAILGDFETKLITIINYQLYGFSELFDYCWGYALAKVVSYLEKRKLNVNENTELIEKFNDDFSSLQNVLYQVSRGQFSNILDSDSYIWAPNRNEQTITYGECKAVVLNLNVMFLFRGNVVLERGGKYDVELLSRYYCEGYIEGQNWFKEHYITDATTFRNNQLQIVDDLKKAYFYRDPKSGEVTSCWYNWLTKYPEAFRLPQIREYGFYAAINVELAKLTTIYPTAFKEFYLQPTDYALIQRRKMMPDLPMPLNPLKVESCEIAFEENDFLQSTIEDYLEPVKHYFNNDSDYSLTLKKVKAFILNSEQILEKSSNLIFVRHGGAKKLASAIHGVYRSQVQGPISYRLLAFLKATFSIYQHEEIDGRKVNQTNLYKYCTTKTQ